MLLPYTPTQVLLVTGGRDIDNQDMSSTEVITYSSGTPESWRFAGQLPSPRFGLRGVTLGKGLFVTGGYDSFSASKEILSWSGITETWAMAGHLSVVRYYHGLTSAPLTVLQDLGYCPDNIEMFPFFQIILFPVLETFLTYFLS